MWEKRDGEWKILHRVIAGDLDRWIHTVNISGATSDSPNATLRGRCGKDDPGNLWFDLLKHAPERPAMEDFWKIFHAISAADRGAAG